MKNYGKVAFGAFLFAISAFCRAQEYSPLGEIFAESPVVTNLTLLYKHVGDVSAAATNYTDAVSSGLVPPSIVTNNATRLDMLAIGYGASVPELGTAAIALGRDASAGSGSIAAGFDAIAAGESSIAVGNGANAAEICAIAAGEGASAAGEGAIAIGNGANAAENCAIAAGYGASATGVSSIAAGFDAIATGVSSIAAGEGASAAGEGAIAVGNGANTAENFSIAIGSGAKNATGASLAIGYGCETRGNNGVAIGRNAFNTGNFTTVVQANLNRTPNTSGAYGFVGGYQSRVTASYCVAIGCNVAATHQSSVALGMGCLSKASNSFNWKSYNGLQNETNIARRVFLDEKSLYDIVNAIIDERSGVPSSAASSVMSFNMATGFTSILPELSTDITLGVDPDEPIELLPLEDLPPPPVELTETERLTAAEERILELEARLAALENAVRALTGGDEQAEEE